MPIVVPKRARSTVIAILVLWGIFYASFTLFTPPLLDDADSVHAEVAREMLVRHDYVTLYANGIRYLEKAPLLYWGMALSFKVFGVSTAAARVPLALAMLGLALVTEAFARRVFRSGQAGLYAALIVLSSFGLFIYTRITLPDGMVCLWLTVAMYGFWRTEEPRIAVRPIHRDEAAMDGARKRWCWVVAAACGLNVLTKGLIGIVFPVGIVGIYLLLTRGLRGAVRRVGELHPWSSVAVFLAIAVPWHVAIALANPGQGHPGNVAWVHGHWQVPLPTDGNVHGWAWFYFVNEQVLRYLNLRVPRDYDTVPLWLFWGLCFVWLMPWSVFIIDAVATPTVWTTSRFLGIGYRIYPRRAAFHTPQIFLILWPVVVVLFFSLSTRQEYYVLPALPALSILIAGWLRRRDWEPRDRPANFNARRRDIDRCLYILLAFGAAFAVDAIAILLRSRTPSTNTDLAQLLQQNPGDYALSFGHFLDLNAEALGLFRVPLGIAAVSLLLGPGVSLWLRMRARPHAAVLALAAGAFGFLLAAHLGLQTFAPVLSSEPLARAIAPQVRPEDLMVIHQEYEFGSTLGFYLRRNDLHILEGRSSNLWYGSFFPDAPKIFETRVSLGEKWRSGQRVFLWQDLGNQPSALPEELQPVFVVAKGGGKEIVSNQPDR